MLTKEEIRNHTFSSYNEFINFAQSKHSSLTKKGVPPEELVNEAIVGIFDVRIPFHSKEDLTKFIFKSIVEIGFHERDLLKDHNFYTKKDSSGKEYSNIDRKSNLILPSKEFVKIYSLFEKARFGKNNSKKICNNCKSKNFYELNDGRLKCKSCYRKMTITSQTYLADRKLSYQKIHKLAKTVVYNPKMGTPTLSKIVGISQKTAYHRKYLLDCAISVLNKRNTFNVLERILRNVSFESEKNKKIPTLLKHVRKFSKQDILEIRRLRDFDIYSCTEVSKIYSTDTSTINKISKRISYSHVR